MIKTVNVAIATLIVIGGLLAYYLHLEGKLEVSKPVLALFGFVAVKLWLRRVNTTTYILFHLVLFGAGYFWLRHFLDSVSTFDMVAMATELLREAGGK